MHTWLGHCLFVKNLVCAVTDDYIENLIYCSVASQFPVAFGCNFATACNPYQNLRNNSSKKTTLGGLFLSLLKNQTKYAIISKIH